jgi:hypothetical protein
MGVVKRVLCRGRLRKVPPQFSWVDQRLVQDRLVCHLSAQALALYLFLVIVADAEGLSYYSDGSISRLLPLDADAVLRARQELIAAKLIAYQKPLYQVLALDDVAERQPLQQPLLIGQILSQLKEPSR